MPSYRIKWTVTPCPQCGERATVVREANDHNATLVCANDHSWTVEAKMEEVEDE